MSSPRRLRFKLVSATILGVLVFAALSFYGDVQELVRHLQAFDMWLVAPALALATANYGVRYVRWQFYLHRIGVEVPHGQNALVFTAGFVMSVTPGKVGEVLKSVLLADLRGAPIVRTAPVVIAERLTDLVALVLLAAIGALALAQGVTVTVIGGALALALILAASWRPLGELGLGLVGRLPLLGKVAPRVREAYESLHTLSRPSTMLIATLLALLSWTLECVALHVVVLGFPGASLPWLGSILGYAVPTVAGAVTLVPGGLGVTEASMTGILQAQGLPAPVAAATTILVRLITLWWAVLLGVGALALLRRQRPELAPAQSPR